MLLEHLEEEFYLPAISEYSANSGRSEVMVVGEQLDLPLVLFVPDYHPTQQPWIFLFGHGPAEANDLVGEDVSALRQKAVMYDFVGSVVFESGNEEDTGSIPLPEELKVIVAPIHNHDAACGNGEMAGGGDISSLAIGDHGEVRQIAVVVKQQVELNGAFGLTEVSPRKQAETEVDDGGVEAEQPVPEAKHLLFTRAVAAAEVSQMKEGILIELPGTVGIGIGKRALGGGGAQSQVTELTAGDGQSVTDLPQALGLCELTEEHGDILVPGRKALSMAFRAAFMDKAQKGNPRHDLKYLAEQTCGKLHGRDSFEIFSLINLFWTRVIQAGKLILPVLYSSDTMLSLNFLVHAVLPDLTIS